MFYTHFILQTSFVVNKTQFVSFTLPCLLIGILQQFYRVNSFTD